MGAREKDEKPNVPQTHKLSPSYLGLAHNGAGAWQKAAEPTPPPLRLPHQHPGQLNHTPVKDWYWGSITRRIAPLGLEPG